MIRSFCTIDDVSNSKGSSIKRVDFRVDYSSWSTHVILSWMNESLFKKTVDVPQRWERLVIRMWKKSVELHLRT